MRCLRYRYGVALAAGALLLAGGGATRAQSPRVEQSVAAGHGFLLRSLTREGASSPLRRAYPIGCLALSAYALLESGSRHDAEPIRKLVEELRRAEPTQVYSLSLSICALDALLRAALRDDDVGVTPVAMSATETAARSLIPILLQRLLEARHEPTGLWGYRRGDRGVDLSNSAFAIRALDVGHRHGFAVSPDGARRMATSLAESACPPDSMSLRVGWTGKGWGLAPLGDPVARESSPRWADVRALAEGGFILEGIPRVFGYEIELTKKETPRLRPMDASAASLSMTCQAVFSLAVVRRWVARSGSHRELVNEWDRVLASGLLGIHQLRRERFDGPRSGGERSFYYTLLALASALDALGVEELAARSWFETLSHQVVAGQQADGSWTRSTSLDVEQVRIDTAFALLFLTRSTRVSTSSRPDGPVVITAGGPQLEDLSQGVIYTPGLRGVVSLAPLFAQLSGTDDPRRRAELSALARRAFAAVPTDQLPRLIPILMASRREAAVHAKEFIATELRRITGLPDDAMAADVVRWNRWWNRLAALDDTTSAREILEFWAIFSDPGRHTGVADPRHRASLRPEHPRRRPGASVRSPVRESPGPFVGCRRAPPPHAIGPAISRPRRSGGTGGGSRRLEQVLEGE